MAAITKAILNIFEKAELKVLGVNEKKLSSTTPSTEDEDAPKEDEIQVFCPVNFNNIFRKHMKNSRIVPLWPMSLPLGKRPSNFGLPFIPIISNISSQLQMAPFAGIFKKNHRLMMPMMNRRNIPIICQVKIWSIPISNYNHPKSICRF
jgi:hypothetical protein